MQPYCRPNTPRAHWWVCTNDEGRVTALDLSAVQAGGESLSELGRLSALRYLDLAYNQLTTLPPELGQLQNLTHLELSPQPVDSPAAGVGPTPEPDLSGSVLQPVDSPAAGVGPTPEPDLSGPVPQPVDSPAPELAQLQNLTHLDLMDNRLTALPPSWANSRT